MFVESGNGAHLGQRLGNHRQIRRYARAPSLSPEAGASSTLKEEDAWPGYPRTGADRTFCPQNLRYYSDPVDIDDWLTTAWRPTFAGLDRHYRMDCRARCSDLQSVIATGLLERRGARRPKEEAEIELLLRLQGDLAREPASLFRKLVEAVVGVSGADSSGISLLSKNGDAFIWPAVAGPLRRFVWDGTPREFGPCGTVLDRDETLLMIRPERYFEYLKPITPPLEEVLLVPFYVDGIAVGTLWAVSHTAGKHFDAEDRRLLESVSTFAASAYQTLLRAGQIESYLRRPAN